MTITVFWPFRFALDLVRPAALVQSTEIVDPDPDLRHYRNTGIAPPSARIHPRYQLRARRPLRAWELWRYGMFLTSRALDLSTAIASHLVWGPRRKSWGVEMTVINAFMRGAGRASRLIDISTIRMLMGLGGHVPLPSDALVTPVTFRVVKRGLKGLLAELDAAETGRRELSGEWVVGRKTWLRLQHEWKEAKKGKHSESSEKKEKERVILYIHGGAYYLSSAAAQRLISIPLSKYTDSRVFAVDYRLAPETRFPGPLHDVVIFYMRLLEDLHIPPENIIVAGDSAGGGLALAMLMYLRDNEYPLPSAAILMSPWVDLTMSCASWDSNAPYDVLPIPSTLPDDYYNPIVLYLGEDGLEKYLTHPYASPLFGNFEGLPPLLIQAGDAEVLRDEICLLAHKATLAGVQVRHEVYQDAVHIFQAYPFLQTARDAFMSCRDFVRKFLPETESRAPQPLADDAQVELEHEIDNDMAKVVRGDGVETMDGLQEVEDQFASGIDTSSADTSSDTGEEDGGFSGSHRFESWGRTEAMESWKRSSTRDAFGSETHRQQNRLRSETVSSTEFLRSAPQSPVTRPRYHRRTLSHQPKLASPSTPHLRPSFIRMSSRESVNSSPILSPSIRRSATSHPDVASLVQQWTNAH